MSQQAAMIAELAQIARNVVTIDSSVLRQLSDLGNTFAAVDVSQYTPAIPQHVENVDAKLLRYISSLEKELSVKEQKIQQLSETLESFKKRLKEKPEYIK
jgi:lipid II:glycine glycyltransferase (peptidoglycan interpeptide bridge formation enzyme)